MKISKLAVVAAVMSLAIAPVAAQAASQAAPAREGAVVGANSEELAGGFIVPLIAIIAVILGILAMTGGDNDLPHSP